MQAEPELASYTRWQEIGRQALHIEARTRLKTLNEVLAECAALVIVEEWLAHGRNMTRAGEALGISRKRVRLVVRAWQAAHGDELDELDECRGSTSTPVPAEFTSNRGERP